MIAVVAFAILNRSAEPIHSGRALSQWLAIYQNQAYDQSPSPEMAEAEMAVRNIGTNGIPFLLQWINYEPPTWRKKLRSNLPDRLANSPLIARIVDGAAYSKSSVAIHGFGILGTNAVAVIPEFTRMMNDTNAPTRSRRATLALSSLGMEGFHALVYALSDPQRSNRFRIIYNLRIMAWQCVTNICLPPLVKALSDQDHLVRRAATSVLESIAPETLTSNAPVHRDILDGSPR